MRHPTGNRSISCSRKSGQVRLPPRARDDVRSAADGSLICKVTFSDPQRKKLVLSGSVFTFSYSKALPKVTLSDLEGRR